MLIKYGLKSQNQQIIVLMTCHARVPFVLYSRQCLHGYVAMVIYYNIACNKNWWFCINLSVIMYIQM